MIGKEIKISDRNTNLKNKKEIVRETLSMIKA